MTEQHEKEILRVLASFEYGKLIITKRAGEVVNMETRESHKLPEDTEDKFESASRHILNNLVDQTIRRAERVRKPIAL